MAKNRKLNIIQVAVSLVSLHYGLGFLFGTTESVYQNGLIGITYAIMCAFGLFFLSTLIPFYYKNKLPIWTLLKNKYGNKVRNLTIFFSWFWMVGVTASQVIGAAYIFNLIGIPIFISIIMVIISVSLISILPIEKFTKILLLFLIINSIILLISAFTLSDFKSISSGVFQNNFVINPVNIIQFLGIAIPTILITMLGMDFHQFIVRGKNISTSIKGSILAGTILILLTFVPTVIALDSKVTNLSENLDGKQLIPYTMVLLGEKLFGTNLKYIFLPSIVITAIGSCACLLRIMIQSFQGFTFIPLKARKSKRTILFINGLIILFLSIKSGSLVSLIVSFYIIYTVSVFIPFLTLLFHPKKIKFKSSSILISMLSGTVISLYILILSKFELIKINQPFNLEFIMITFGIFTSLITLISDKICKILLFNFYKFYSKNEEHRNTTR
jgi:SSS family solute:Na+ symporter